MLLTETYQSVREAKIQYNKSLILGADDPMPEIKRKLLAWISAIVLTIGYMSLIPT